MNAQEIFTAAQGLETRETRNVSADFVEVVLATKDLEPWQRHLESVFGPALKPAGAKPGKESKQIADAYGGIRNEQTLFHKTLDQGVIIIALLWPWGSGTNTTLKIYSLRGA